VITATSIDLGPTGGWTIRRKTCATCGEVFETTTGLPDCAACRKAEKAARKCACGRPAKCAGRCWPCYRMNRGKGASKSG
jgi:hypothetical protein